MHFSTRPIGLKVCCCSLYGKRAVRWVIRRVVKCLAPLQVEKLHCSHHSSRSPPEHPSSFGERRERDGEGKRNKDQDGFPSFPLIRMAVLILLLFLMASLPFSSEKEKQREKGNMKGCERDTWSSLVPSHSLVLYHPPSHPNSRFSSGEGKGRGREREREREREGGVETEKRKGTGHGTDK